MQSHKDDTIQSAFGMRNDHKEQAEFGITLSLMDFLSYTIWMMSVGAPILTRS